MDLIGTLQRQDQNQQAIQANDLRLQEAQQAMVGRNALRSKPAEQWTADDYMAAGMPERAIEKYNADMNSRKELLSTMSRVARETVLPNAADPAKFAASYKSAKDLLMRLHPQSASVIASLPENPSREEVLQFVSAAEQAVRAAPKVEYEWADAPGVQGKQQFFAIVNGRPAAIPGVMRDKTSDDQVIETGQGWMKVDKSNLPSGKVFAPRRPSGGEGLAREKFDYEKGQDKQKAQDEESRLEAAYNRYMEMSDGERKIMQLDKPGELRKLASDAKVYANRKKQSGGNKKPLNLDDFRK